MPLLREWRWMHQITQSVLTEPRPINPLLTAKDILHCMNLVKPTHVAVSGAYYDKVQEVLQNYAAGSRPKVFSVLDRIERVKKVSFAIPFLMTILT